jgi:hypothetical protein
MTSKEYNNQFSKEELEKEIWKDVPNYEGYYQVSNLGRIKSLPKVTSFGIGHINWVEKILKPSRDKDGYFCFVSCIDYKKVTHKIHQIVLLSFGFDRPLDSVVCHNDGNRSNNRLTNLRWGTCKENRQDQIKHGNDDRGEKSKNAKLKNIEAKEIRKKYSTGKYLQRELGKKYGVSQGTISFIVRNITFKEY